MKKKKRQKKLQQHVFNQIAINKIMNEQMKDTRYKLICFLLSFKYIHTRRYYDFGVKKKDFYVNYFNTLAFIDGKSL